MRALQCFSFAITRQLNELTTGKHRAEKQRRNIRQMVRLIKGGQEVRFSKRAGEVVGLDDLLVEVGSDVARFVFLMRSTNAQFDLDLDEITRQLENIYRKFQIMKRLRNFFC